MSVVFENMPPSYPDDVRNITGVLTIIEGSGREALTDITGYGICTSEYILRDFGVTPNYRHCGYDMRVPEVRNRESLHRLVANSGLPLLLPGSYAKEMTQEAMDSIPKEVLIGVPREVLVEIPVLKDTADGLSNSGVGYELGIDV